MENSKHIPYNPSVISPEEYEKERQRLRDLIQKRSEGASQGVAEMLKHPYSLEQMIEQEKRMDEQVRKDAEARRRTSERTIHNKK